MKQLWVAAAVAAIVLSGCGGKAGETPAASSSADAVTTSTTTSIAPETPISESADVPDPCTFLSEAEVTELTSLPVTQVDHDDAKPWDAVRFCQWQLEGGQLVVTLHRIPKEDFIAESEIDGAVPVADVGELAHAFSGHLYVLSGQWELDVYYRGAESDEQNIEMAKKVALVVIPRLPV